MWALLDVCGKVSHSFSEFTFLAHSYDRYDPLANAFEAGEDGFSASG